MTDLKIDDDDTSSSDEDLLTTILAGHPLTGITDSLSQYLGIGADVVSFTLFLSRAAGRLGLPFNVTISSDDPSAEHLIADRLINIVPEGVKRVETIKQLRELAESGFEDTEVVVVRSLHDGLFRFASESTCRDVSKTSPPSVWLISDNPATVSPIGPTLSLLAQQTERSLSGFGHHYSAVPRSDENPQREQLRRLLLALKHRRQYPCPFQHRVRAALKPYEMLIVNRMLATVAALRIELAHQQGDFVADVQAVVSIDDYRLVRSLLANLPISSRHSTLTPCAAETGELLYEAIVKKSDYQKTLPDHSTFGKRAFTRRDAEEITQLSYNTIKDHLAQLEGEGIIESLVVDAANRKALVRRQGRQIHFRFANTRSPPFGIVNLFSNLPTTEEIATDCMNGLQSQDQEQQ